MPRNRHTKNICVKLKKMKWNGGKNIKCLSTATLYCISYCKATESLKQRKPLVLFISRHHKSFSYSPAQPTHTTHPTRAPPNFAP